jgi:hypothetical protein
VPGGYQCFESASSAHEHVPILIGAAIFSPEYEEGPHPGPLFDVHDVPGATCSP